MLHDVILRKSLMPFSLEMMVYGLWYILINGRIREIVYLLHYFLSLYNRQILVPEAQYVKILLGQIFSNYTTKFCSSIIRSYKDFTGWLPNFYLDQCMLLPHCSVNVQAKYFTFLWGIFYSRLEEYLIEF